MHITLSRKSWHARLADLEYETTLCEYVKVVAWEVFLRGILTTIVIVVAAALLDFTIYLWVWFKFRPMTEFELRPLGQLGSTLLIVVCMGAVCAFCQTEMFHTFWKRRYAGAGRPGTIIRKILQVKDAVMNKVCVRIKWID